MADDRAIWLTASGEGGGYVEPKSLAEVAVILRASLDQITPLRYGPNRQSVMWMVKSHQGEMVIAPNRSATLIIARFNGLPLAIRGDVVCFPHDMPWAPPRPSVSQAEDESSRL